MKVIKVIKHGEGSRENGLTEWGRKEVERFAQRLSLYDIIIAAPSKVTKETAEIIAITLGTRLEVTEVLEEISECNKSQTEEKLKKVLEFLWKRKERGIVIIAPGRLISALYLHLLGEPIEDKCLDLFNYLKGFEIQII